MLLGHNCFRAVVIQQRHQILVEAEARVSSQRLVCLELRISFRDILATAPLWAAKVRETHFGESCHRLEGLLLHISTQRCPHSTEVFGYNSA